RHDERCSSGRVFEQAARPKRLVIMEQTGKQRKIGLARALSKLGYCSRSNASELIRNGQVTLNGKVRRDPETPTHPTQDRILVNGHPLKAEPKIYLLLNKPRG